MLCLNGRTAFCNNFSGSASHKDYRYPLIRQCPDYISDLSRTVRDYILDLLRTVRDYISDLLWTAPDYNNLPSVCMIHVFSLKKPRLRWLFMKLSWMP